MASPSKAHTRTPSTATTTTTSETDNPQNMVITSLRSQVGDLVSQVTQLNSKLVQSYDRISDLEDNMHIASSTLRNSTLKISQLELERTQHLSALNTGLLVEKSHVTTELTRLMERATDEAARRGMAESARQEIEKDLDDLSAELFGRANTMVAEARLAQAKSERRVQDTEAVLKGAEDAVTSMQAQMQVLREEKDRTDHELNDIRDLMGKGKWVERERSTSSSPWRLLSTHAPYQEFLLFVAHLRQIRPGAAQPPPMATLLPLPFLARLVSEDSDPTLRLDTAPALNWLTRRAVSAAIHQSQLTVEPISAMTLLETLAPPGSAAAIAAFSSQGNPAAAAAAASSTVIPCALCGTPVLPPSFGSGNGNTQTTQPSTPSSWRPTFFSRTTNANTTPAPTPPSSQSQSHHIHSPTPSVATSASFYPPSASSRLSPPPTPPPQSSTQIQVHVFRVPATGASTASPTLYPLCSSGWCLARLRTTCEVWRFVRRGVVEKVWAEEVPAQFQMQSQGQGTGKPPVPPRRRMNVGKLFGLALGKKEAGPGKEGGAAGGEGEEKFSPSPVMGRRMSGERRRGSVSVGGAFPPPPPLPRRSDTRVVRVEEEKVKRMEEEAKAPAPVEGAMLFDADSAKPEDHPPENGHANPTPKDDDPFVVSAPNHAVDPAELPLPPSPTTLTERADLPTEDKPAQEQEHTDTSADETAGPPAAQPAAVAEAHSPARDEASTDPALPASQAPSPLLTTAPSPSPSRTASPAPPPLPRRAPRRAAPVPPGAGTSPRPEGETMLPDATDGGHTPTDTSAPLPPPPVHPSLASESHAPPPLPLREATPVPPQHNYSHPPPPPRDPSPHRPSEEQEAYVGDVTWEERTWKEFVRLREDMFYARVGTVR